MSRSILTGGVGGGTAQIGGFVPVAAPIWKSGTKVKGGISTVTSIKDEDGATMVTFNEAKEMVADGGFEGYHAGDKLITLNSNLKNDKGWTGFAFDGSVRYSKVVDSAISHSGEKYVAIKCPYSSIFLSLKLKPHTEYVISFWVKGLTNTKHNLTIGAREKPGEVFYIAPSGNYMMDKDKYNRILYDRWYNNTDAVKEENGWQKMSFVFKTIVDEYVDICIHFNADVDERWFDDFSVVESVEDVFTASYAADKIVPDVITVGSEFYIECYGDYFTRFEYVSDRTLGDLYRDFDYRIKTLLEKAGVKV